MSMQGIKVNYPQSISEGYELIKGALLSENEELINKAWKFINEAEGDWVWVRAKLLTDCYELADAEGREEFCLLALQEHLEKGRALELAMVFVDDDTKIEYQEFLMPDKTIYRIPIVFDGMDKYTFQKALQKKFIGDFLEMHSVDGTEYTLLDTKEKVDAYNDGTYFQKFVYGKNLKNLSKKRK